MFSLGKRREAYITEMQRLRDGSSTMGRQAQGSLTISDIRLPIKREFMSRIGGPHGESDYFISFMLLISSKIFDSLFTVVLLLGPLSRPEKCAEIF